MRDISLCTEDNINRVFEDYKDTVFRIAYNYTKNRADADDIFQNVFLRYFRNSLVFQDKNHEKAWFIRVTINCSKKLLTSAWFKKTSPLEDNIKFETKEKSDLFYAVLSLPVKYRIIVHLYYYEDYSVKEISQITGRKQSTIQSQLMRARGKLKEALEGDLRYE